MTLEDRQIAFWTQEGFIQDFAIYGGARSQYSGFWWECLKRELQTSFWRPFLRVSLNAPVVHGISLDYGFIDEPFPIKEFEAKPSMFVLRIPEGVCL